VEDAEGDNRAESKEQELDCRGHGCREAGWGLPAAASNSRATSMSTRATVSITCRAVRSPASPP